MSKIVMTQGQDKKFIEKLRQPEAAFGAQEPPWRAVCEFVEGLEGHKTPLGFCSAALKRLESFVGFDHGAALVSRREDLMNPVIFLPHRSPVRFWETYMDHFVQRDPIATNLLTLPRTISFDTKDLGDTAFAREVRSTLGDRCGAELSSFPEGEDQAFIFTLYREGPIPFDAEEMAFLRAVYPHLRNLSMPLLNPENMGNRRMSALFGEMGLSARESQIAALILGRFGVGEISERLFISPRTVEKHLQRIYARLGAGRKLEAFELLSEGVLRMNPSDWGTRAVTPERY